jgi:UDP-glucose 4-epimerase
MVTGAGGFLGSHVADHFASLGHELVAVGRFSGFSPIHTKNGSVKIVGMTLPDRRFVDAVRNYRPKLLVHCAGTASVPNSVAEPYVDFQRTVDVCAFVIETLRTQAPDCHFVYLSSAAVYGNPEVQPITEETPTRPVSPYGYHKMLCELLTREAAELQGMRTSVVRIFSAYGSRQQKQVVFDLFRRFSDPVGNKVEILGTGDETRDFVHAHDVARSIEVLSRTQATGIFNVASGQSTSIRQLAELLSQTVRSSKELVFSGQRRVGDPIQWRADITKLTKLGYVPSISLQQGLDGFVQSATQTGTSPQ